MASSYETFKDLELTRDEVERIADALKDKEFRKLLTDYVEEVRNPDNQKLYQEEITQLEKERGIDVTFINPEAGYVIKTSINGTKKAFINICSNENVQKPTSDPEVHEGSRGLHWSLPHTLTPPREDVDNKNKMCVVYDVVFHTDTLHLASKSKAFYEMVNKIACDAIETNFNVNLDKKNLKFPKLHYKGYPNAAVVRKASKVQPPELSPQEKEIMDKLYAQIEQPKSDYLKQTKSVKKDDTSLYTTPEYVIKHRRSYEMHEFTDDKHAKLNTAIPKELVIEINLPLLKASSDIVLDVSEKNLLLQSEKPAKYKLSLTLPYHINQDNGNAKFDKDKKKLVVSLPVKFAQAISSDKDDSGIDTDFGSLASSPLEELRNEMDRSDLTAELEKITSEIEQFSFLDKNYRYTLPDFVSHLNETENIAVFTVNVKNVDKTSLKNVINVSDFHIQFSSISSGFYATHYALYVSLNFVFDNVVVEVWDNNLTVQVNYAQCDERKHFLYGLDPSSLFEKVFEIRNGSDDSEVPGDTSALPVQKRARYYKRKYKKVVNCAERSRPIDIFGTSESSGEELSLSLSPHKGRGILKSIRNARRSVSESGLDEVMWASSIETNFTSVDSVIPEEGEISSSLKKTVRFNDVVSRKLFRSNSSILGQRKKNQRKAKAKKRAQERRHSESEISEISEAEDKKERDAETSNGDESEKSNESTLNLTGDIFELDMN